MTKQVYGHYWFYSLVPKTDLYKKSLFDKISRSECGNRFVVSLAYKENGKDYRLYSVFKNYLEFVNYMLKFPQHQRCFFEIILGEFPQKPHFDIDISDPYIDPNLVLQSCLDSIISTLQQKDIILDPTRNIAIYTSHGQGKHSFHIIIDGYYHANCEEAKAFYNCVIGQVSEEYKPFIDSKVYSTSQQFRILGNTKLGHSRFKNFQNLWTLHGQPIHYSYIEPPQDPHHKFILELATSLVTVVTDCLALPSFIPQVTESLETLFSNTGDEIITDESDGPCMTLTQRDGKKAVAKLAEYAGVTEWDPRFPYRLGDVQAPWISLKRIKPSMCKMCDRVHQKEHPFLYIVGRNKDIFFYCRRNDKNKKLYIGQLSPSNKPPKNIVDVTNKTISDLPLPSPKKSPPPPKKSLPFIQEQPSFVDQMYSLTNPSEKINKPNRRLQHKIFKKAVRVSNNDR